MGLIEAKGQLRYGDPCHTFNDPKHGVNLKESAKIAFEAFKECKRLSEGQHSAAAHGATDLIMNVYRERTKDPKYFSCVLSTAYRPRDSRHWKEQDDRTKSVCKDKCWFKQTSPFAKWDDVPEISGIRLDMGFFDFGF